MKASILLTLILFKSLLIDPANAAAITGRHELDCIDNVLFNEQVMKTLLSMNEEDCLDGFPDPGALFKHIKFTENPSDDFETRLLEIPLTLENLGIGTIGVHSSRDSQNSFVDQARKEVLEEYQLNPDFDIEHDQKVSSLKGGINIDLGINESRLIEEQVEEVDAKSNLEYSDLDLDFEMDPELIEQIRKQEELMKNLRNIELIEDHKPIIREDNLVIRIKERPIINKPAQQDIGAENKEENLAEEGQPDIKLSVKIDEEVENTETIPTVEEPIEDDEEIEAPLIRSQQNTEVENPFESLKATELVEDQENRPSLKNSEPVEVVEEATEEFVAPFNQLTTSELLEANPRPIVTQVKTSKQNSSVRVEQPTVTLDVDHQQKEEVKTEVVQNLASSDDFWDEDIFSFNPEDLPKFTKFEPYIIEEAPKFNIINDDRTINIVYNPKTAKNEDPVVGSQSDIKTDELPEASIIQSNTTIEEPQTNVDIEKITESKDEVIEKENFGWSVASSDLLPSNPANLEITHSEIPASQIKNEQETKRFEDPLVVSEPAEDVKKSLEKSEIPAQPTIQEDSSKIHTEKPDIIVDVEQNRTEEIKTSEAPALESSNLSDSLFDFDIDYSQFKIKKIEPVVIDEDKPPNIIADDIILNIKYDFKPKIQNNEQPSNLHKSESPSIEEEPAEVVPDIKKSSVANPDVEESAEDPFDGLNVTEIAKEAITNKSPFHNLKVTELINQDKKPSTNDLDSVKTPNEDKTTADLVDAPEESDPNIKQSSDRIHVSDPVIVVDVDETRKDEIKISEQHDALEDSEFDFGDAFDMPELPVLRKFEKFEFETPKFNIINDEIKLNIKLPNKPKDNNPVDQNEPVEEPEKFDFPFDDLTDSQLEKENNLKPQPPVEPTPVVETESKMHVSDPFVTVDVDSSNEKEIRVSEVESINSSDEFGDAFEIKFSIPRIPTGPVIDEPEPIKIYEDNREIKITYNKPTGPVSPTVKSSESSIKSSVESIEEPSIDPINKTSIIASDPNVKVDINKSSEVVVKKSELIESDGSMDWDKIFAVEIPEDLPKIIAPVIVEDPPKKIYADDIEIRIADRKPNPNPKASDESVDSSRSTLKDEPVDLIDPNINVIIDASKDSEVHESIKQSDSSSDSLDLDFDFNISQLEIPQRPVIIDEERPEPKLDEITLKFADPRKNKPDIIKSEEPIVKSSDSELDLSISKTTEKADDVPDIRISPAIHKDSEIDDEEDLSKTEIVNPNTDPKIHHSQPDIVVDVTSSDKVSVKESIISSDDSDISFGSDLTIDPVNVPKYSIDDPNKPKIFKDDLVIDPIRSRVIKNPSQQIGDSDESIKTSPNDNIDPRSSVPQKEFLLHPSELTESQDIIRLPIINPVIHSSEIDDPTVKRSEERPDISDIKRSVVRPTVIEPVKSVINISEKSDKSKTDSFIYKHEPAIEINHFRKSVAKKDGPGKTRFVVQTVGPRVMSSALGQTKASVAHEIFKVFPLLHKCVQKALLFCNPNYSKLKTACENASGLECEVNDFSAKIKCAADEELINNACYKKCPEGFTNYKFFCLKPTAVKRATRAFQGETLNDNEELYADNLVVEKCAKFGKYMADFGPDYCKARCPMDFRDRGLFCQKPARFQKQQVHVFSRQTTIRSE